MCCHIGHLWFTGLLVYTFFTLPLPFCLTADVDECAESSSSCGAHAQCVNLPGSHRCQCQSGYEFGYDGRTCVGKWQLFDGKWNVIEGEFKLEIEP